ncbi:MAG TPA: type II restriction endonuclease [Candidatus Angelobacter sp.]|nr:type II restriction endonuclease [Candidatus Angelobacter sp.]
MTPEPLQLLIERWREDTNATYKSWFLWEERLKNFRSIRRGLQLVVTEMKAGTFGSLYKGSSLETVVKSIAEQRQIFKGADHAFLWKPKLRIPDIYESRENQIAFADFLDTCSCCSGETQVLAAIRRLDEHRIKGLGPAAANLLYFLHPTIIPPFNTAIVNGYNLLTGAKVKLGSWEEFLAMREGILRINGSNRTALSNDLGAIGGLLFDIGSGRYSAPPLEDNAASREAWERDLARVRELSAKDQKELQTAREGDRTHTEVQGWLRDLGKSLGFDIWIAANDRNRALEAGKLGDGCLAELPPSVGGNGGADSVRLIDVLWLSKGTDQVAAAFEVEHTTSIYSGILRLLDLGTGIAQAGDLRLFLVAPDARENDVRDQLLRPAFRNRALQLKFLPYGALEENRVSMARFGTGIKPVEAIARILS